MEVNDVISRQVAIDAIITLWADKPFGNPALTEIKECIDNLPSAQPTDASCWGCNCPKMERLKEQKTFSEMVHLHDAETHEERTETHGVCLDTISRQAAIDALMEQFKRNTTTAIRAKLTVEAVPSAQPEIIRCKDCKWWSNDEYRECSSPNYDNVHVTPAGFYCGYAERRRVETSRHIPWSQRQDAR